MPIFSSVRQTGGPLGRGGRIPYKFRQIITRGYVAGGYKDSVLWRNVNYVVHATDTSTSLGDLLQQTANYTQGASSRDRMFVFGAAAVNSVSNYTAVFNMRNDTTYTHNSAMNTPSNIGDCAVVQDDWYRAWIFNTGTNPLGAGATDNVIRFDLTTETAGSSFAIIGGADGEGRSAHYNDTTGFIWGTTDIKYTFSTETQVTGGNYAAHGQQKGQNTKNFVGYAGNEGSYNGGFVFRKWNQITDSLQSTHNKPIGNSGEENIDMGQDWGYMLGMYDGAQNNRAWKWTYATDSGFEGSATMQPKGGQGGRSSAAMGWRD